MTDNNALAQEQLAIRIENRARISAKQNVIVLKDEIPLVLAALRSPEPAPVGGDVATREQIDAWLSENCGSGLPYGEARDLKSALHGLAYVLRQIEGTNSYTPHIGQTDAATSSIRWALDHFARAVLQPPPEPAQDVEERVASAIMAAPTRNDTFAAFIHEDEARSAARAAIAEMPPKVEADQLSDYLRRAHEQIESGSSKENIELDRHLGVKAPAADEEIIDAMVMAYQETTDCGCSEDGMKAVLSMLRECLSHPTADAVEQWQPIETAPKDGTPVLILDISAKAPEAGMAWFIEGEWVGENPEVPRCDNCSTSTWRTPTHWMPLPNPPAAIRSGGAS